METWEVVIVGGGAAGLLAASRAAERGRRTLLLEKKKRPGAKILMSGGTRCNITHALDAQGIVAEFANQGSFLYSALAALSPEALIDLIEAEGVETKIEPTGKIFPASDRADDVLAALLARLKRSGCTLASDEEVQSIERDEDRGRDVLRVETSQRTLLAEKLILTTGGQSYPSSGSTGDGYRWAAELGHTIVPPRPALVPITSPARWVLDLQGITLPDVIVRVLDSNLPSPATMSRLSSGRGTGGEGGLQSSAVSTAPLCLAERRGSLLFTHFGVSGPAALDVSRAISGHPKPSRLVLSCDLLPDERPQALEASFQEACRTAGRRLIPSILAGYLPQRIADAVAAQAGIETHRRAAEVTRKERQNVVARLKQFDIPIGGTLGFNKAEVTAGGVSREQIDSHTMQSRLIPGLFFAGEIIDIDGPIGGYNFQAAFSTGWLAGESV